MITQESGLKTRALWSAGLCKVWIMQCQTCQKLVQNRAGCKNLADQAAYRTKDISLQG